MKKYGKQLLAFILCICSMFYTSLPTFAANNDSVEALDNVEIVHYEDLVSDGTFEFLNITPRINSSGYFTFEGNQIVSTIFKSSSSTINITTTATSENSNQNYTITLWQGIDNEGTGYRDIQKYTYVANGTPQTHSYTGLTVGRPMYIIIKTTGFFNEKPVNGTGSITNYVHVY